MAAARLTGTNSAKVKDLITPSATGRNVAQPIAGQRMVGCLRRGSGRGGEGITTLDAVKF